MIEEQTMADLTASDVTVAIGPKERDMGGRSLTKRMVAGTIAFGDGVSTYPANGVPLPAIGNFNMVREIGRIFIEPPVDALEYRYDAANHSIRMYQYVTGAASGDPAAAELSAGVDAVAAVTLGFMALGE
jgi:hypothetical protein